MPRARSRSNRCPLAAGAWGLGTWPKARARGIARRVSRDEAGQASRRAPRAGATRSARLARFVGGVVTLALPFALSVLRLASSGTWRSDLATVRDVGLVSVGLGGAVSTALTQALVALPVGNLTLRASLGSALACALAARVLFELTCDALALAAGRKRGTHGSALEPAYAAVAALLAALSPSFQLEATVGGGAMVGAALALSTLLYGTRRVDASSPAERLATLGTLAGLTLAESPVAGLATMLALGLHAFLASRGRRERAVDPRFRAALGAGVAALVATCLVALTPALLRPLAPHAFTDLGRMLTPFGGLEVDPLAERPGALAAWLTEVGVVSTVLALVGAGVSALALVKRGPLGPPAAATLSFLALDLLLPARVATALSIDPFTPLRLLAVSGLALAGALGVARAVTVLRTARVPLARAVAVLLVAFQLTLVALSAEEAGFVADRSAQHGAEAWTDEALGRLPPSAAVLVRSQTLGLRLFAARVARGERADVVVLPERLLDRGRVTDAILAAEPKAIALLRDVALRGVASEAALSSLADARPLMVELEPAWAAPVRRHLVPRSVWLEYLAQPVGPSDRKAAEQGVTAALRRILSAIDDDDVFDVATTRLVSRALSQQAEVLVGLREKESAEALLSRVAELETKKVARVDGPLHLLLDGVRQGMVKGAPPRKRSGKK